MGVLSTLVLRLFTVLFVCFLLACANVPTPDERGRAADALAAVQGWKSTRLQAGIFTLAAYLPESIVQADSLTVYIEGDGLAWITGDTPSDDPTPRNPIGLKLALAHPDGAAAYLGRPCQYTNTQLPVACQPGYWTDKRFAPEVVAATSVAVDALKGRFGARYVQLVGYSGGGAVAALLSARRSDVTLLVTVAGNLDTKAWTDHFHLSPLKGSLNPADFAVQLAPLRQVHLVGEADRVVPSRVTESFASRFGKLAKPGIRVLPGYDHACCWEANWAALWSLAAKTTSASVLNGSD